MQALGGAAAGLDSCVVDSKQCVVGGPMAMPGGAGSVGKTGSKEVRAGQHQSPGLGCSSYSSVSTCHPVWGQGGQDTNKACYCCWFTGLPLRGQRCLCRGYGVFRRAGAAASALASVGLSNGDAAACSCVKNGSGSCCGQFSSKSHSLPPGCYLRGQGAVLPCSGGGGVPLTQSSRRQSMVWLPR